uniref:FecR protein domain-containing protein n=1 Tax=Magnetococcus massalia (strain MO-1) TaxID=451514 RepID=A0A1S7LL43_MAGMO|nr:conserved exported protein of unknown function [Candidatus Magnetococcus massalia]
MAHLTYRSSRRTFLRLLLASGLAAPLLGACMSAGIIAQGVRRLKGELTANGRRLKEGEVIPADALLETGRKSQALIVVGKDAMLLRENSRVQLHGHLLAAADETKLPPIPAGITGFLLQSGAALSVFAPGGRQIKTPEVTVAIRGTGVYLEKMRAGSYVCTCYGRADLIPTGREEAMESVQTFHHESPRFVKPAADQPLTKAPVFNHTDAELIMLEELVLRRPPFVDAFGNVSGGAY